MQKMLMTLMSTHTHVVHHVRMYNICRLDNRTGDTDSKVRRVKREREREREREGERKEARICTNLSPTSDDSAWCGR